MFSERGRGFSPFSLSLSLSLSLLRVKHQFTYFLSRFSAPAFFSSPPFLFCIIDLVAVTQQPYSYCVCSLVWCLSVGSQPRHVKPALTSVYRSLLGLHPPDFPLSTPSPNPPPHPPPPSSPTPSRTVFLCTFISAAFVAALVSSRWLTSGVYSLASHACLAACSLMGNFAVRDLECRQVV